MKLPKIILLLPLFFFNRVGGQTLKKAVEPQLTYEIITMPSSFYEETRRLKIALPPNYSKQKKYPVIYVSDAGTPLFDMALTYLRISAQEHTIPESIVVGIPHQRRGRELDIYWSEHGVLFKNYLFQELIPFIDSTYASSGFNVMVGHSDGAEFNQRLMLEPGSPFRGFINMSPSLNVDISELLNTFFQDYQGNRMYYFIASGRYDLPERIAAGEVNDSLYTRQQNPRIRFTHELYQADHENLIAKSLLDGIFFIFQDYRNLDLYPNFQAFSKQYVLQMKEWYGISIKPDFYDIDFYFGDVLEKKDLPGYESLMAYTEREGIFEQSTLDRANQYFYMEYYPQSIQYWEKTIEDMQGISPRVFYYNFDKAVKAYIQEKNPQGALVFLEKCINRLPQFALVFHYFKAKVALENEIQATIGQVSLEYCQNHFEENRYFDREDLQKLSK